MASSTQLGALVKSRRPYTQPGLGSAVGLSGKTITAIETGEVRSVSPSSARQLSRVLGVSVADLCRAMGYEIETGDLTPPEAELVQLLRRIPEESRETFLEMCRGAARGALLMYEHLVAKSP
jgi:DNA-binding XRE family transcriptional regulator